MAVNVVDSVIQVFVVEAKPKSLKVETILALTFTISLALQFSLILLITFDNVVCTDDGISVLERFYFSTSSDPTTENQFVEQICETDIKFKAAGFYWVIIIYLCCAGCIVLVNKYFMDKINRYDTIIRRQKIKKFIGYKPVVKSNIKNYRKKQKKLMRFFIPLKSFFCVCFILATILQIILTQVWEHARRIIEPHNHGCGEQLYWVDDIMIKQRCHFNQEFMIFVLYWSTIICQIITGLLFVLSVFIMIRFYFIIDVEYDKHKKPKPEK
eukprot:TRINITY_DN3990_c1_g1_i1.p1 TRINITY_DN3990_c1_g1~~TRINITY_DN3990_c1_g1_i1.p1  ORF type:complete len:269 (+),score=18.66 TRINITY_DN3990_c1_g1_i1:121-927(+)